MKHLAVLALLLACGLAAGAQDRQDALQLYRDGRYEESVRVCREELAQMPRNMDSYTVLGWSLLALRQYDQALEAAQQAMQMAPYDHRIIQLAGEALYNLGKNREALAYFEQYATLAPVGPRIAGVYYQMGEIFIRLEQYSNADMAFSTALHFDSRNARWWSRLGYARETGGDLAHALEAYENALKLNSSLVEAQRGLESVKRKMSGG